MASVLASWLDNDQDGCVDNPTVLTKLLEGIASDDGGKLKHSIIVPGKL